MYIGQGRSQSLSAYDIQLLSLFYENFPETKDWKLLIDVMVVCLLGSAQCYAKEKHIQYTTDELLHQAIPWRLVYAGMMHHQYSIHRTLLRELERLFPDTSPEEYEVFTEGYLVAPQVGVNHRVENAVVEMYVEEEHEESLPTASVVHPTAADESPDLVRPSTMQEEATADASEGYSLDASAASRDKEDEVDWGDVPQDDDEGTTEERNLVTWTDLVKRHELVQTDWTEVANMQHMLSHGEGWNGRIPESASADEQDIIPLEDRLSSESQEPSQSEEEKKSTDEGVKAAEDLAPVPLEDKKPE